MKQFLLLSILLLSYTVSSVSQVEDNNIVFSLFNDDIIVSTPGFPHAPIVFPQATLDDHTLYITRSVGAELLEVRQNDVVVYQTFITGDNPTIVLPDTITGECELVLYCPVFTFTADIEM